MAYSEGDTMPQAVDIDDDSRSENVQRIKALILKMTSYKPQDRPTSLEVYRQTYHVHAGHYPVNRIADDDDVTTDVVNITV